ncbi:nitrate reductase molybdenum cofactor assembly chaperone NarJ [mine drainage metagenome]|uniref:Nitrate reductase molybdenum cofactor assembly chaperone NarJ n=1 Tax=mine drainage metagenome TaxID=410659 RepID=A0A1J5QIZ5_9ZZZZ
MRLYKFLSVLLEYPEQELLDHLQEIHSEIDTCIDVDDIERTAVQRFVANLQRTPLTELQTEYVQTFDLTPEHSLHLTHHLFGDDKNRGPALIDLGELYKDYGVEVVTNELPDYLPLILEFAAHLEEGEANVFLSDAHKVLGVLADNLNKAGSPYAALLSIIQGRATLTRLAA